MYASCRSFQAFPFPIPLPASLPFPSPFRSRFPLPSSWSSPLLSSPTCLESLRKTRTRHRALRCRCWPAAPLSAGLCGRIGGEGIAGARYFGGDIKVCSIVLRSASWACHSFTVEFSSKSAVRPFSLWIRSLLMTNFWKNLLLVGKSPSLGPAMKSWSLEKFQIPQTLQSSSPGIMGNCDEMRGGLSW